MTLDPYSCTSTPATATAVEAAPARRTTLGSLEIVRALPARERRMVGPWCFFDRYGPLTFADAKPMDLGPHPHIGLQTVSWLLEGELLHRDSLGSETLVRPGQLNLMTAGRGIAHSEETPMRNTNRLSGAQLWIAQPDEARNGDPAFDHFPELPSFEEGGGVGTVILGELGSVRSPAGTFTPAVGADLSVGRGATMTLPLRREFEHALFVFEGGARLDGTDLVPDVLYYLGIGRDEAAISTAGGARLLLLGGEPFRETILMWWNYVARTSEEIVSANEDWANRRRFGDVPGYRGPRIEAPPLRGRVRPPAAS